IGAVKKDHENRYSNTVTKDLYENMQNTQANKMAEIINLNYHLSTSELNIVEETIQNEKNSEINKEKQSPKIEEWQVKRNIVEVSQNKVRNLQRK
ncbi:hypothetical protein WA026_019852, partial [Henosepilachna vigintioctopunctata]